jgi:hypothetical protein
LRRARHGKIDGVTADASGGEIFPDEVETETLLAQGDELIRSSRHLLDEIDDVLPTPRHPY